MIGVDSEHSRAKPIRASATQTEVQAPGQLFAKGRSDRQSPYCSSTVHDRSQRAATLAVSGRPTPFLLKSREVLLVSPPAIFDRRKGYLM